MRFSPEAGGAPPATGAAFSAGLGAGRAWNARGWFAGGGRTAGSSGARGSARTSLFVFRPTTKPRTNASTRTTAARAQTASLLTRARGVLALPSNSVVCGGAEAAPRAGAPALGGSDFLKASSRFLRRRDTAKVRKARESTRYGVLGQRTV